ncbi:membrane protein insertase YidC [Nakamurella sp. A5-74]|uniref:Membrane protein insertase YidC n=1 Tax=Nakamurella sp. A5-74 TaxID=3158264 RepID=A0AAU8DPX7_9ACTN
MTFDFFSLDYLYYPVSGIMWVWHKVWGALLGPTNGWGWVLSVVFLVFTLRLLLFKPFMKQMDSQLKMQAIQPQMKKLREKYAGDRQRLAEEMMKLNKENGVSAVGGCLPALIQAPVFIGLFHVLRMFQPQQDKLPGGGLGQLYFKGQVYFFGAQDVQHFGQATLFGGAPLGGSMSMKGEQLAFMGGDHTTIIWVGVPLTILAGIMTHLTSRRSVARQASLNPEAAANPQSAIMNKLMLYVFPAFVVIGGPFFPLAILFYWLANNSWTFGQLWFAHRVQDKRKALQAAVVVEEKQALRFTKPAPGARPTTVVVDSDVNLSKGSQVSDDPPGTAKPATRPSPGARPSGAGGQRPNRPGNRPSSNSKKKRKR